MNNVLIYEYRSTGNIHNLRTRAMILKYSVNVGFLKKFKNSKKIQWHFSVNNLQTNEA